MNGYNTSTRNLSGVLFLVPKSMMYYMIVYCLTRKRVMLLPSTDCPMFSTVQVKPLGQSAASTDSSAMICNTCAGKANL